MIYVCLLSELWDIDSEWRIIDIHKQKPDPYRNFDTGFWSTGLCRNHYSYRGKVIYERLSYTPQNKTYELINDFEIPPENIYFLYYSSSSKEYKKWYKDYYDYIGKNIYLLGLLQISKVYESHKKVPDRTLPNIVKNKNNEYRWCINNAYVTWKWRFDIISEKWEPLDETKISSHTSLQKDLKRRYRDGKSFIKKYNLWWSMQKTWIWLEFNNEKDLINLISSLTK